MRRGLDIQRAALLGLIMLTGAVCLAQKPELVVQVGHQDKVRIVGFVQNGKGLVTQDEGSDGALVVIKIWDAESGTLLRTISATDPVALSPDQKTLAAAAIDGSVKVWDVATGERLRVLKPTSHDPKAQIRSISFSRDGRSLAALFERPDGEAETARIETWEVAGGETKTRLLKEKVPYDAKVVFTGDGQAVPVEGLVSPDGKLFARLVFTEKEYKNPSIEVGEVGSNNLLFTLKNQSSVLAFSPDSRMLTTGLSVAGEGRVKFWDVSTGAEVRTLASSFNDAGIDKASAFSPDGKVFAILRWEGGSEPHSIKFYDVASGALLQTIRLEDEVDEIEFSPDGKSVAEAHQLGGALWDVSTGRKIRGFTGYHSPADKVFFSPDGKSLVIRRGADSPATFLLWELATGREPRTFAGDFLAFGDDGRTLLVKSEAAGGVAEKGPPARVPDSQIKVIDVDSGAELRTIQNASGYTQAVSRDGGLLASYSAPRDNRAAALNIWNVKTGQLLKSIGGLSGEAQFVTFSPDGSRLAAGVGDEKAIFVWDVKSGQLARKLLSTEAEDMAEFSPDGKTLASVSGSLTDPEANGMTVKVWQLAGGRLLYARKLSAPSLVSYVALSPDGKFLAGSSLDVDVWDAASGAKLHTFGVDTAGAADLATTVSFSPDSRFLVSSMDYSNGSRIQIWDLAGGAELPFLKDQSEDAQSADFSPDSKTLVTLGRDGVIRLWDVRSEELLASLVVKDPDDWVVSDPTGRFDATPAAQKSMHFVIGLEPIALEQLKERYYEPNLLSKIINRQPLRDVSKFENPRLNPAVQYEPPAEGRSTLTVSLANRGGGIGRVQVFVNGKEFLADARDEGLRRNPYVPRATLTVDLSKATGAVAGSDNDVRVVAWNVENYISSRGAEIVWRPEGQADGAPPEVYAVVGGISSYAGPQLDLNFAAKDAVDIADAIELGAKRLFGADRVHLTLLTTAEDPRAVAPTKENFTKAFEAARRAKPTDILIVYLAGHGVTLQRGSDTYCYLTEDARTADTAALSDSEVRGREAITSEEMVEWIKQIPALKQVVVLDTCAAGAAETQLRLVDKREASGDAIRAIDRAKERTGSYILMGSAADAVSYEASQYGQGLLTYALLKGMKGAALRNDEFVDVSKLFQYAREEVEVLAKDIGGIQRPVIFAPKDDSFEVGQLKPEDKQRIRLAAPKPMILRPRFLNAQADDDTLDLMKVLRALLRDESFVAARAANQPALVFVDDEDFPGGIRPTGHYTVEGNDVTVTLRLRRDGKEVGGVQTITGTKSDVPGLAAKVLEAVKEAVRKL